MIFPNCRRLLQLEVNGPPSSRSALKEGYRSFSRSEEHGMLPTYELRLTLRKGCGEFRYVAGLSPGRFSPWVIILIDSNHRLTRIAISDGRNGSPDVHLGIVACFKAGNRAYTGGACFPIYYWMYPEYVVIPSSAIAINPLTAPSAFSTLA